MRVSEAVARRYSARAFLPQPVARETVAGIVSAALRAPSGGNLQPWKLQALTGAPLQALLDEVADKLASGHFGEPPDYEVYPKNLFEPYRSRRFQTGEDLYASLAIGREEKAKRLSQFAANFRLFGAPVGLFVSLDRRMGPPQWSDLGMFLQTLMLLAVEAGLDTCAQEAWSQFPQTLAKHLDLAENDMVFCGVALGYADPDHPINQWRTRRAALDEVAIFRGF